MLVDLSSLGAKISQLYFGPAPITMGDESMHSSWKQRLAHRARRIGTRGSAVVHWARREPPRAFALGVAVGVCLCACTWFFTSTHSRGTTAEPSTDGRYYFAYLPSMVFDRDLDLANQYRVVGNYFHYPKTATERVGNVFSIGPALYALPTYLVAHGLARLRGERADGYSKTEKAGAMFASVLFSLGALLFAYLLVRRRLGDRFSTVLVVLLLAAGGPLVYYAIRQPGYSHPFAAFWVAWLVDAWDRTFDEGHRPRSYRIWIGLGALLGLAALARTQLVLWGALYLLAAGDDLQRAHRGAFGPGRRWLTALRLVAPRWGAGAGAALLAFAPQMIVWKVIYGDFILVPQGMAFMRWTEPAWHEVLFSARNGLLVWAPLYAVAAIGLFAAFLAAFRRHGRLAGGLLLGVALQTWTNGAVWDWWAGVSFGARRFDSCFVAFVFGLGFLLVRPTWQGPPGGRWAQHWPGRLARTCAVAGAFLFAAGLSWSNLTYAAKMDCTRVRGHHRGPASRILRREIGSSRGRLTAWASDLASLPARAMYAWHHGARLDAYDHVVGKHLLNERYPWPRHRRRGGRVATLRLTRATATAPNMIGFVEGPSARSVRLRGTHARILFGLNLTGSVQITVHASAPGADPVEVLIKVNGHYLAREKVPHSGKRIGGRITHPARGTNTLDITAPNGAVLRYVKLRHLGWNTRTPG